MSCEQLNVCRTDKGFVDPIGRLEKSILLEKPSCMGLMMLILS